MSSTPKTPGSSSMTATPPTTAGVAGPPATSSAANASGAYETVIAPAIARGRRLPPAGLASNTQRNPRVSIGSHPPAIGRLVVKFNAGLVPCQAAVARPVEAGFFRRRRTSSLPFATSHRAQAGFRLVCVAAQRCDSG